MFKHSSHKHRGITESLSALHEQVIIYTDSDTKSRELRLRLEVGRESPVEKGRVEERAVGSGVVELVR